MTQDIDSEMPVWAKEHYKLGTLHTNEHFQYGIVIVMGDLNAKLISENLCDM